MRGESLNVMEGGRNTENQQNELLSGRNRGTLGLRMSSHAHLEGGTSQVPELMPKLGKECKKCLKTW